MHAKQLHLCFALNSACMQDAGGAVRADLRTRHRGHRRMPCSERAAWDPRRRHRRCHWASHCSKHLATLTMHPTAFAGSFSVRSEQIVACTASVERLHLPGVRRACMPRPHPAPTCREGPPRSAARAAAAAAARPGAPCTPPRWPPRPPCAGASCGRRCCRGEQRGAVSLLSRMDNAAAVRHIAPALAPANRVLTPEQNRPGFLDGGN